MIDQPSLLVLRADADSRIGAGHVMRGLALAQEWQRQGGEVVFVGNIEGEALLQRLESEGFQICRLFTGHPDSQELTSFLPWLNERRHQAGWVVLDGYHFEPAYHRAIRGTGWPLLIIDDYAHLPVYYADVMVNPNAYGSAISYPVEDQTLLLLGARFALLRKEFRSLLANHNDGGRERYCSPCRRILVTMGGADPDNVTEKVIGALQRMSRSDLEIKIVVGPLNPYLKALDEQLRCSGFDAEILSSVTDMSSLMRWADLAISAAGSTCWELAAFGVPMAVLVLADNQERVAATLVDHGVAVNLGWHYAWQVDLASKILLDLLDSRQKRQEMGEKGEKLIDGLGCERLTQAMRGYHFSLRAATEEDCEIVFQWANDPLSRAVSFSRESITWQEHRRWFSARVADPDHIFYIAITPGGLAMAQARFSIMENREAVISVSLASAFRGVGLGSRLIRLACEQASVERPIRKIRALVKQGNAASFRAFTQAGFRQCGTVEVSGQQAVAMDYAVEGVAA